MPDFYLQEGQRFQAVGVPTAISESTELTASASTNTKGSYSQLIASTGFASAGLIVTMGGNSNTSAAFLTDIAIGAGGSEQIIIPDLFYLAEQSGYIFSLYIPMPIKAGTRIAARTACSTGSGKHRLACTLVAGGFPAHPGVSRATTYGTEPSISQGTSVVASSTANTKGSWTQIVSATTAPMKWAVVMARTTNDTQFVFDIGVGGSGSEAVVVPDLNVRDGPKAVVPWSFPLRIPKGARISARSANSAGGASKDIRLLIIGVG